MNGISKCYKCDAHFEVEKFYCENGHHVGNLRSLLEMGSGSIQDFNCSQCGSKHYIQMVNATAYTLRHGDDLK